MNNNCNKKKLYTVFIINLFINVKKVLVWKKIKKTFFHLKERINGCNLLSLIFLIFGLVFMSMGIRSLILKDEFKYKYILFFIFILQYTNIAFYILL